MLTELGLATTAKNKVRWLVPQFGAMGVKAKAIPLRPDISELEHSSPRRVLRDKLESYGGYLETQLDFWIGVMGGIDAIAVFDLLAMGMPDGPGAFGQAGKVWKKAGMGEPVGVAAGHFREMAGYKEVDGHCWTQYSPGSGIAPIRDYRIVWERSKTVWGKTLGVGFSRPLLEKLGNEDWLREHIESGELPDGAFVGHSIGGMKVELLIKPLTKLAAKRRGDGMSMMIRRGRERWLIDGKSDLARLRELAPMMEIFMANAPTDLVGQMAHQLASWA